jgi:hypothetical protein
MLLPTLLLVVGLLAAGCSGKHEPRVASAAGGSASDASTSSGSPAASGDSAALGQAAAQCMRTHGIPDFPDPKPDPQGDPHGGFTIDKQLLLQYGNQVVQNALRACSRQIDAFEATQPVDEAASAEQLAEERQIAACMRTHGYPDFPDPDPQTGGFGPNMPDKADPQVHAALLACQPSHSRPSDASN